MNVTATQVQDVLANNCQCIAGLSEVLRKHTFVGMADETLALLQHTTRLYLLNVANLSKDMFYQQVCFSICPSAFALPLDFACYCGTTPAPEYTGMTDRVLSSGKASSVMSMYALAKVYGTLPNLLVVPHFLERDGDTCSKLAAGAAALREHEQHQDQ